MHAFWAYLRAKIRLIASGICVGTSDLVPGISGGTVAFIIGIYEELLQGISSIEPRFLFRFEFRRFFTAISWHILLPFLLGVSIAFICFAHIVTTFLHHETYSTYLYATFMGLVVGSSFFCLKMVKKITPQLLVCMLLGALGSFFMTHARLFIQEGPTFDLVLTKEFLPKITCCNVEENKLVGLTPSDLQAMLSKKYLVESDTLYEHDTKKITTVGTVLQGKTQGFYFDFWLAICGALAVSAMLLPGISGSYILQILGVYGLVLSALVDFISELKGGNFDVASFQTLTSCALGILAGAIIFSRVMKWLFTRYRNETISVVIGFMLGALHAVWPFRKNVWRLDPLHLSAKPLLEPDSLILPSLYSAETVMALGIFFCAVMLIVVVEYLARISRSRPYKA